MTNPFTKDNLKTAWAKIREWSPVWAGVITIFVLSGNLWKSCHPAPAKVVYQDKVVTKVVEKVVYQDKVVYQKVYVQVEKKHEHTETTTIKKPDGEVVTTTKVDVQTDDKTQDNESKVEEKIVYRDRVVDQVHETIRTVTSKSLDWRVSAGPGIAIPYFLGQGSPGVPGLQGFVIQAGVDRRILGPIWLGIQANTQGVLGLNLSGVF